MKKLISIILTLVIILGLCACGGNGGGSEQGGSDSSTGLQVGFGREKMMPKTEVALSGGEDPNKISTGYLDILYATCLAFTDKTDTTALVLTLDMTTINAHFADPAKEEISKATGVPVENIMFCATHTHSSPAQDLSYKGIKEFHEVYIDATVKAAQAAMADRSPAEISIGSTNAEGLVFVRHYELSNGTYAGSSFGDFNSGTIVGHAYESDDEVQLVKFTRAAEDKKDIVMMNTGVHATFVNSDGTTTKNISADFPGHARSYVEEQTDCHVAYFIAAGGDQTGNSKIKELDPNLRYDEYGKAIGKVVVDALPNLKPIEYGDIKFSQKTFVADVNKPDPALLEGAKLVADMFASSGEAAAAPLVAQYGFQSVYEAKAVVRKSAMEDTKDYGMNAMSIGELSFIFASIEMFSTNGRYIKDNTPYDMTFVITCCNASNSYVANEKAYGYKSYESYAGAAVPGTGEKFAEEFVEMLKELKAQ